MENKDNENKPIVQRKTYGKPAIEVVPLFPKQTVLGETCFTQSSNTGSTELPIGGCGLGLCELN